MDKSGSTKRQYDNKEWNKCTNLALYYTSPVAIIAISGSQSMSLWLCQLQCHMTPQSHVNSHNLTPIHIPIVLSTTSCPNQWLTIHVSVPLSALVSYHSPEPCKLSPLYTNRHTNAALYTSSVPISGSQPLSLCPCQFQCHMTPQSHVNSHHSTPVHTPMLLSHRWRSLLSLHYVVLPSWESLSFINIKTCLNNFCLNRNNLRNAHNIIIQDTKHIRMTWKVHVKRFVCLII